MDRIVYGLEDPRDCLFHYIGHTNNVYKRFNSHITGSDGNVAKNGWIWECRQSNIMIFMREIERLDSIALADERETYWIRFYLLLGHPLHNLSKAQKILRDLSLSRVDTYKTEYTPQLFTRLYKNEHVPQLIENSRQEAEPTRRIGKPTIKERWKLDDEYLERVHTACISLAQDSQRITVNHIWDIIHGDKTRISEAIKYLRETRNLV